MASELTLLLGRIIDLLPADSLARAELTAQVARIGDGVDEYRLSEQVTSHETVDDVSAPTFSVIRPSLKSIFVAWTGVAAVSGHGYYELQVSTTASEAGLLDTRQTATTWTIFDALNASGATYHFRIRAVDAAGHVGDWSGWTNEATDPQLHGGDGEYLQSDNYVAGSSGWKIDGDGDAEFNSVTVRGTVTASTVESSTITSSSISASDISGGTITGDVRITIDDGSGPYFDIDPGGWGTSALFWFYSRNASEILPGSIELFDDGEIRILPPQFNSADGYMSLQSGVGGTNNTRVALESPSGSIDLTVMGTPVSLQGHSHSTTTGSSGPPGGLTNTVSGGSYQNGTTSGPSAGTSHTHTYDRNHTHSVGSHTHTVSI